MTRETARAPLPFSRPVAAETLARREAVPVSLALAPEETAALARFLDLRAIEGVALEGRLLPADAQGWRLEGRLAATVEQACVVTLEPVRSAIEVAIDRRFVPAVELRAAEPDLPSERELGHEDDPDPFDGAIELAEVVVETLALAIDPYPRAEGAELGARIAGPPGVEAMTDEAARPFAKLAALAKRTDR